jgi:catechol 2,3-dioxygenase-like lactoylglutathione lyase family enzyme
MSSVEASGASAAATPLAQAGELKLEVVVVPVADVDRAKELYSSLGWTLDADSAHGDELRIVQLTPPGSSCSIQFGTNIAAAAPGSAQGMYLVVADIETARGELLARGVDGRGVPRRRARVALPRLGARVRRGAGPAHVRLVRRFQRSGWQRLAAPGDHNATAGSLNARGKSCRDEARL